MLTPEAIETKEFKKAFRGYSEDDVNDFLLEVKDDYEALVKENEALKEKLSMYADQVSKYSSIESTLKETLITAQSAAEDTTNAANKKARVIVQEAELQAKQIISKANNTVLEIRNEYESILKEFKVFRIKFKSMLENQIKNVDEIFSDIEDDNDSFNQVNESRVYDATGTIRMQVLEDAQEEEDTMELNIKTLEEENVPEEESTGNPEDIFKIK